MDSINQQQPENNYKDLTGKEALKKVVELAKKSSSCFFCTRIVTGQSFSARPMAVQKIDEQGCLWFMSAKDSNKNEQLMHDPYVQLLFQGSEYSDFLMLYGDATISTDKEKIKELWNPFMKTWFTNGIEDERITVIKVEPWEGYYWDTKHGMVVASLKRVAGAMLGKTLDDSIEGMITL